MNDRSHGYEGNADRFLALRAQRRIGEATVQQWANTLTPGSHVLDLGCGDGLPVSDVLIRNGFKVSAIDASPRMVAAYHARFPDVDVRCEAAEDSTFFMQTFDAIIAVGLMFLLTPDAQRTLIAHAAAALRPNGQFVFTAPESVATWTDAVTGCDSQSLGSKIYRALLTEAGLTPGAELEDEGGNCYFVSTRPNDDNSI